MRLFTSLSHNFITYLGKINWKREKKNAIKIICSSNYYFILVIYILIKEYTRIFKIKKLITKLNECEWTYLKINDYKWSSNFLNVRLSSGTFRRYSKTFLNVKKRCELSGYYNYTIYYKYFKEIENVIVRKNIWYIYDIWYNSLYWY